MKLCQPLPGNYALVTMIPVSVSLRCLDKCPGVRPIGIGESAQRIIGRAIVRVLSKDIQEAAGPLQLCAGQLSGCESAVHPMRELFKSPEIEVIIPVDATNSFNSLNRQATLRNIHHLCAPLSKILINTYLEDVCLFIDGETLLSQEGITQGDSLAMAMYAIVVTPLIHQIKQETTKQVWFADDATAGGKLTNVCEWWDHLTSTGPDYGYFWKLSKT